MAHSQSSSYRCWCWVRSGPFEPCRQTYSLHYRGLVSYKEFLRAGYDVKLYERDEKPGGVWHYSEEVPLNAPVPNAVPAAADYKPCLPPKDATLPYEEVYIEQDPQELSEQRRAHRAPKPIWASLKSNAPAVCACVLHEPDPSL